MSTAPAMDLAQLQQALSNHILHGDARINSQVLDQGGLPASERLRIYHSAYRWRLLEVMQDHFEQTHTYLGDELFNHAALTYIEAHPPEHHSLRHYGQAWPDWLAAQHPEDQDMADLARLEWALRSAFDAADAKALTMTDLAQVPADAWASLGFELAPGAQVLDLTHAVIPLWQSLSRGEAPEPVMAQPTQVLVWRQGWQPHFKSIDQVQAQALQALLRGGSFTEAGQVLGERLDAPEVAGQWLQAWVSDGLLCGVVTPG